MTLADEQLDTANACHDDEPQRGADLLRGIDPAAIDTGRRPLLAFLLNHVFGEKRARWDEALALQRKLLATEPQPGIELLRHAAAAAALAGDGDSAASFTAQLAAAAGDRSDAAQALVALSEAGFTAPALDADGAAAATLRALQGLDGLHDHPAPGLDAAFGAVTNNLASHLAERTIADLGPPRTRTRLARNRGALAALLAACRPVGATRACALPGGAGCQCAGRCRISGPSSARRPGAAGYPRYGARRNGGSRLFGARARAGAFRVGSAR